MPNKAVNSDSFFVRCAHYKGNFGVRSVVGIKGLRFGVWAGRVTAGYGPTPTERSPIGKEAA